MRPLSILALTLASIVAAQKVGNLVPEEHPKLSWQNCSKSPNGTNSCSTVDAEVVLDAEWRWVRNENSISNCYTGNQWDLAQCNTTASCTSTCALEGADAQSYKDGYGITTTGGNTLSQKFVTLNAFSSNVNSRVFLLDPGGVDRYQTFMLMENELAFDVELSSVECAINSALYFVAMEDDGGMARYPTNEAGARLGDKEFYGKGKAVDTSTKFTVVTQFAEDGVKQFFVQDGKKIETPAASYPGFPDTSGLSPGYCEALPTNFQDPEYFAKVGGYARHNEALQRPMVLTMSISNDHWANNLWLDSTFPSDRSGLPGAERGPCPSSGNGPEPQEVERYYPNAKVAWSNIRFGPIGTTM
ncbi:hypothetical protein SGCOL_001534 [Colletotrichum sp. CLE4]